MTGKTRTEKYVFPRVPLKLEVPRGLPDIGQLNSMAVVPVLERYQVLDGELEIWGSYNLRVFYQPAPIQEINENDNKVDDFLGCLQKQADGLFDISDEGLDKPTEQRGQIYSWKLDKKFHTYAEISGLKPGGKLRVQPTIDKIELEVADSRSLKGSLTVALDIKRG